jgi:hypothetical protein
MVGHRTPRMPTTSTGLFGVKAASRLYAVPDRVATYSVT